MLDKNQAEKELQKRKKRAEELLQNSEKSIQTIEKAYEKSKRLKGPLDQVWEQLQLIFQLFRDWFQGNYREIPFKSIIVLLAAVLYFLSPIDLIPDLIPLSGLIDDAGILALVISQFQSDLDNYQIWKSKQNKKEP